MSFESTFKKYKRLLETIDIARYTVSCNNSRFKVAAYNRLGSTKGYLVLREDGEVSPREEAILPYKMFIAFNSYMFALHEQGQAESKKPTAVFQDTINLLEQINPLVQSSKQEIDLVTLIIIELDKGYQRIREIHPKAMKIYEEMMNKCLLDDNFLGNIRALMKEFTSLQYKHLHLQINAREHLILITKELNNVLKDLSGEDKKAAIKAEEVFKFLTEEKYQSGLKNSLIEFEKDPYGNQKSFYKQADWEQALSKNSDEKNNMEFQKKLLAHLRN
ncbi:hypothetical protein WQ54_31425 [Bacillus sp. SA1-12]|uniref:hypothetical protein n=1 Tax=Bacillus sp. SA1-12 TaxID=1455638 RepID=UPI000626F138|nr:hypothetical protein [Bacillus sp. SA1-12]KKI88436.1 hypothetical protein WQ54_31425 [Bacillus sp. SA1-12]